MREKFVILMAFNFITQVYGLIIAFIKVKFISVFLIGAIVLAGNITSSFTMFLDLGISAIYFQYSSKSDFQKYFGSFFTIKVLLILANYIFPFIWYWVVGYDDPIVLDLIKICLWTGITQAIGDIFATNLRVKFKIIKVELVTFIIQLGNITVQLFIVLNVSLFENPAIPLLQVNLYSIIIRSVAYFLISFQESIFIKPDWAKIKRYFVDAKPIIIQVIITVPYTYLGSVLLGIEFGLEEMAYYAFAWNYFVNVLLGVSIAVSNIFGAVFPKMFAEHRTKEIISISTQFERYALIVYLLVVLFVQFYISPILDLILPTYIASSVYIRTLIFVPFLDCILRPYIDNLLLGGRQDMTAKVGIGIMGISLVMQIILIPKSLFSIPMLGLGAWGLVINALFIYVFKNFIYRYYSKKYFQVYSQVQYGKIIGVAAVVYGITFIVNIMLELFISEGFFFIFVSALFLVGIYLILLFGTHAITREDIKFALSLLEPSDYWRSLRQEIKEK